MASNAALYATANRGKDDPPYRPGDFLPFTDGPLAPDPADRRKPAKAAPAARPAAELEAALRGAMNAKPKG